MSDPFVEKSQQNTLFLNQHTLTLHGRQIDSVASLLRWSCSSNGRVCKILLLVYVDPILQQPKPQNQ
jgi:hypothetical protein